MFQDFLNDQVKKLESILSEPTTKLGSVIKKCCAFCGAPNVQSKFCSYQCASYYEQDQSFPESTQL